MALFKYWEYVGTMSEIENYVMTYDKNEWNCEPIPFNADEFGLIKDRHSMPVSKFLLGHIQFGPSYGNMEKAIIDKLKTQKRNDNIIIYVTGYTPAVIAAINAARMVGYKEICLKHFDKDTGIYLCQWAY